MIRIRGAARHSKQDSRTKRTWGAQWGQNGRTQKTKEGGEPLCYVADTTKRKGDARWCQGIFLGKSVTNDMFLVHCEGNVRLTRSVKSIYKDWSEHMGD